MINNRILWWLGYQGKLPESQNGFRKNSSCADNLTFLCVGILKAFKEGLVSAALFLDIKSAYDNVLPDVLVGKLKRLGSPPKLMSFIYNLISERCFKFQFGEIDESQWVHRGLRQGSALSPIHYVIYVMDLDSIVNQDGDCEVV